MHTNGSTSEICYRHFWRWWRWWGWWRWQGPRGYRTEWFATSLWCTNVQWTSRGDGVGERPETQHRVGILYETQRPCRRQLVTDGYHLPIVPHYHRSRLFMFGTMISWSNETRHGKIRRADAPCLHTSSVISVKAQNIWNYKWYISYILWSKCQYFTEQWMCSLIAFRLNTNNPS